MGDELTDSELLLAANGWANDPWLDGERPTLGAAIGMARLVLRQQSELASLRAEKERADEQHRMELSAISSACFANSRTRRGREGRGAQGRGEMA